MIRTYNGNIPVNTPHQFVSASKYRVPGMKIYVKVGAGVYTYHAAYLSDDGPYCNMRFPDGSIGRMENRVLDGLFTDYVASKIGVVEDTKQPYPPEKPRILTGSSTHALPRYTQSHPIGSMICWYGVSVRSNYINVSHISILSIPAF